MILNTLKNFLLIGVLFVATSNGQNSFTGPGLRGSNGTTNGSYPINNTNVAVVPQSVLINYTRVCDYPTDTIIALRYTYD